MDLRPKSTALERILENFAVEIGVKNAVVSCAMDVVTTIANDKIPLFC